MILIIYLGRKGGGKKLLLDIAHSKEVDQAEICYFVSEASSQELRKSIIF
jgi:hypothetical protein